MAVVNQNFRVYRGNTYLLAVALTNADGSPYNSETTVQMLWRLAKSRYASDDETLVRKSIDDGIAKTEGGVEIALSASDTDLPPGLYYHELKIYDASDVATAMTGNAVIRPSLKMGERIALAGGSVAVSGPEQTMG